MCACFINLKVYGITDPVLEWTQSREFSFYTASEA